MIERIGEHTLTKREKSVLSDCFWTAGWRGLLSGTTAGGILAFAGKCYFTLLRKLIVWMNCLLFG